MSRKSCGMVAGLIFSGAAVCVLSLYSTTVAAPQGQPPFADALEQRAEMIQQLREIKELLKEQNLLLRGGAKKAAAHEPVKR